ncbi:MAG: DegT/DnrJ/EryC1/StrS family aminotransferase, partial [Burkholderiales bacterium]
MFDTFISVLPVRNVAMLVPDMPRSKDLLPWLQRIDSKRWYTNFGPLACELEARLEQYVVKTQRACPYVTSLSNCTVGLELTLSALNLKKPGRVLVPALTFVATATAVLRSGHALLLADVD